MSDLNESVSMLIREQGKKNLANPPQGHGCTECICPLEECTKTDKGDNYLEKCSSKDSHKIT
jgi:hypothetical protein